VAASGSSLFGETAKSLRGGASIASPAVPACRGAAGNIRAVSVAAPVEQRGAEVEFETKVFKKEKVNLAGREEVGRGADRTCPPKLLEA